MKVKQYMDDIIAKLIAKDRKHKVSVKKKFIDEALQFKINNTMDKRSSQVYVIVINREKDYDPIISQKLVLFKKNDQKKNNLIQQQQENVDPKIKKWENISESSDEGKRLVK